MPDFNGLEALTLAAQTQAGSSIFFLFPARLGEDAAIEA